MKLKPIYNKNLITREELDEIFLQDDLDQAELFYLEKREVEREILRD